MKSAIFLLFAICVISTSCKKEQEVNVNFYIKETSKTANNRSYALELSKLKILFSNFKLTDNSSNDVIVKDVFLYKTSNSKFSFKIPEGNFESFSFSFGLDAATNNSIPTSFSAAHPLSVENGLYWDMLKYRFLVAEGNIDDSPLKNETPDAPFSMHLGTDTLYTTFTVTDVIYNGSSIDITMDLDKLFVLDSDPFQIINFSNHSEPSEISRGIQIKNSFVNGITTVVKNPK